MQKKNRDGKRKSMAATVSSIPMRRDAGPMAMDIPTTRDTGPMAMDIPTTRDTGSMATGIPTITTTAAAAAGNFRKRVGSGSPPTARMRRWWYLPTMMW